MRPRIVVTQRIHPEVAAFLGDGADLAVNEDVDRVWTDRELLERTHDADALMVFMPDSFGEAFLAECPRLIIVAGALKGFDNFDVEACTARGVWFTIVPDLLSEPTAELALALLLGLARNIAAGDRMIRSGQFSGWRPTLYGASLVGATVGIVGFGRVGRTLDQMLQGFSCRILHHDVDSGVPLDELLAASDFVLPLVPLNPSTLHLLNGTRIAKMRRGAFLVNVGRGSVVDEEAVADALERGHLGGYAADTFEMEDWARPDRPRSITSRLLRMTDKTLFTPHLGSAVRSIRFEIEMAAARNIQQALSGQRPEGAINNL